MVQNELQEQEAELVLRFNGLLDQLPDLLPVREDGIFSLWKTQTFTRVGVEPWYDVNVNVKYVLRGRSPVGLADVYAVRLGGLPNAPHDLRY